jgi:hypothetical protein
MKSPILRHPRLPPVFAFVVLLGAEGRVAEVLEQEQRLLVERRLDVAGRFVFLVENLPASL